MHANLLERHMRFAEDSLHCLQQVACYRRRIQLGEVYARRNKHLIALKVLLLFFPKVNLQVNWSVATQHMTKIVALDIYNILYNRTNEMHFLSFIFDNNLYLFRTGNLFIIDIGITIH